MDLPDPSILFPVTVSRLRCLLLAAIPWFFTAADLRGQDVQTPAAGSEERQAIVDAVRVPCERDLKQEVILKVEVLRLVEGWAYTAVTPQTPSGGIINYRHTKFKGQAEADAFEPTGEALLRRKNDGTWTVVRWRLGATDSALPAWIKSEDAPKSLDP